MAHLARQATKTPSTLLLHFYTFNSAYANKFLLSKKTLIVCALLLLIQRSAHVFEGKNDFEKRNQKIEK